MPARAASWLLIAAALIASPSVAQIPEAPGNPGPGPRDEHPGHGGSGLAPAVVPTEGEATAPEIIDLMNRSRANAEGTRAAPTPKPSSAPRPPRRHATPSR